jgi:hypothetical protein
MVVFLRCEMFLPFAYIEVRIAILLSIITILVNIFVEYYIKRLKSRLLFCLLSIMFSIILHFLLLIFFIVANFIIYPKPISFLLLVVPNSNYTLLTNIIFYFSMIFAMELFARGVVLLACCHASYYRM